MSLKRWSHTMYLIKNRPHIHTVFKCFECICHCFYVNSFYEAYKARTWEIFVESRLDCLRVRVKECCRGHSEVHTSLVCVRQGEMLREIVENIDIDMNKGVPAINILTRPH